MKKKFAAILLVFTMAFAMAACGAGEETTLTGMIVSVDGTVVSLAEMDLEDMESGALAEGERPQMPEGMGDIPQFEDFDPEEFNPEDFEGMRPEGGSLPQWGEGEMPERPEMPEGMTPPEGMTLPEGMTMPEDGEMPAFGGEGGMQFGFGAFGEDLETTEIDVADAHISVEIDAGKESGSMDNLTPGAFVTLTLNGKGEVTNVLVSSQGFFGFAN